LEEQPLTVAEKKKFMDAMSYDHSSPQEALAYILEQDEKSEDFPVLGDVSVAQDVNHRNA